MAALIDVYEQQYAVLTADITCKIGKLSNTVGSERRHAVVELEKLIDETRELLEQMGLEVHEHSAAEQPKLKRRVESYRAELGRLHLEFSRAKNAAYRTDGSEFEAQSGEMEIEEEPLSINEEQKRRLLDNSERIERTGKQLTAGYQVLLETEDIGSQVLRDLHSQRETIQKARNRLRETDAELGRSNRLVSTMIARSLQHRFLLTAISVTFGLVILGTIYYSATRGN